MQRCGLCTQARMHACMHARRNELCHAYSRYETHMRRTLHGASRAAHDAAIISISAARVPTATAHKTSSAWSAQSALQGHILLERAMAALPWTKSSACPARRTALSESTWLGRLRCHFLCPVPSSSVQVSCAHASAALAYVRTAALSACICLGDAQ
jgi:hypothetical protein